MGRKNKSKLLLRFKIFVVYKNSAFIFKAINRLYVYGNNTSIRKETSKIKKVSRYVLGNWFWIVVGLVLTKEAIKVAYIERGYKAYGGEWLVLPLVLIAVELARNICDAIRYLSGMEENL